MYTDVRIRICVHVYGSGSGVVRSNSITIVNNYEVNAYVNMKTNLVLATPQISRWDRLKGWRSLLEGWVLLKTHAEEFCDQLACLTPSETYSHDTEKHLRMIRNSVLVLAGPEPKAIADDPEGTGCLAELKGIWDNLSLSMQRGQRRALLLAIVLVLATVLKLI